MEFTGKTVQEAIELGLKELNINEENANIKIIEEPTKGLFGRLKSKAKVEISIKDCEKECKCDCDCEKDDCKCDSDCDCDCNCDCEIDCEKEGVLDFVKDIIKLMNFSAQAEISTKDEKTIITLKAENSSDIIGYRGEVIDAIQSLAGAKLNIGKKEYQKIVVDCEDYRNKREDTLIALALKLEAKATEMRREVMLEPMSPYERRIIHTALSNSQTCSTRSDGKEPNRYVVIVPNDKDEFSKPYNAGRNRFDKKSNGGRRDKNSAKGFSSHSKNDKKRGGSGFIEKKKSSSISFGTYLGNSLKDK